MNTLTGLSRRLLVGTMGFVMIHCLCGAKPPPSPSPSTAPSDLAATALGPDQIQLTWKDNSSDEREFDLARSTSADFAGSAVLVIAANMTQYTDTGLQPGTGYYYRVRARIGKKFTDYSNVASATTPAAPPPPNAPGNLTNAT